MNDIADPICIEGSREKGGNGCGDCADIGYCRGRRGSRGPVFGNPREVHPAVMRMLKRTAMSPEMSGFGREEN